jgi:hypothetical protein
MDLGLGYKAINIYNYIFIYVYLFYTVHMNNFKIVFHHHNMKNDPAFTLNYQMIHFV